MVWFTPLDRTEPAGTGLRQPAKSPQLVQRNKTFEPHVLIVPVGTVVEFPNKDPFFHNIFSLYDGRRFDLGLYEAGTKRSVRFDRPGVSFLFCNIHAEMSAVVVSVDTPYFGLSDRNGNVVIRNVPDGPYQLTVWYERSSPEHLKELTRVISDIGLLPEDRSDRGPQNPTFTPTRTRTSTDSIMFRRPIPITIGRRICQTYDADRGFGAEAFPAKRSGCRPPLS